MAQKPTEHVKILPPPPRPPADGRAHTTIGNTITVFLRAERLAVPEPIKKRSKPAGKDRKPTKGKKKN